MTRSRLAALTLALAALAGACDDLEGSPSTAGQAGQAGQAGPAGQAGQAGKAGQAGAGAAGAAGAEPSCQASDESFVQRASVAVLGHRVAGHDEARLLVDLLRRAERNAAGSGKAAVVDALMLRNGRQDFVRRWSDTLADFLRVPRVDEMSGRKCHGVALRAPGPELAAFVRDTPAYPTTPGEPFTVGDVIASALLLDDLSPALTAQSLAMLTRSFVGANAEPEALELSRRAAFGAWFSGVYLRRDINCLACHTGEFSVTASADPAKNRHFPLRTDLEHTLFGDPAGPVELDGFSGEARLSAPFRYAGFSVASFTVKPEDAVQPWGWTPDCGSFAPPGQVSFTVAPVDAALGSVTGAAASGWDVAASLQRGFQRLRAHGLSLGPDGALSDRDEALAYLAAVSLSEAVWTDITGGHLTVAHNFPRNAPARDRLQALVDAFLSGGASLRALLIDVVSDPIFNALPPSEGCGSPAPWAPLLDPWTAANSDPDLKGNGPGDLVAPLPARRLLRGLHASLGWESLPQARGLFFATSETYADEVFLTDIGAFQKGPEPGFRGFDTQAALAWEQRTARCLKPEGVTEPDAIERIVEAARSTPEATLGDACIALKDRLIGERFIDPGSERTVLEFLLPYPLTTQASQIEAAALDTALRLHCGVLVASPQFRLSGLDTPVGPAPRLAPFAESSYAALCQALAGKPVGGWVVDCGDL